MRKKHRALCNFGIDVAWTGQRAAYLSPPGDYGEVGYSELAMHTKIAGKRVVQYALWVDRKNMRRVTWAHVRTEDGRITDGLPHEVLPSEVLHKLGYQQPALTFTTRRLLPNPRRRSKIREYYRAGYAEGVEAARANLEAVPDEVVRYARMGRLGEFAHEIREHQIQFAGDISYDVGQPWGPTQRQYEVWEEGFYRGFVNTVEKELRKKGM